VKEASGPKRVTKRGSEGNCHHRSVLIIKKPQQQHFGGRAESQSRLQALTKRIMKRVQRVTATTGVF
jgi:hypothetical protein